MTLKNYIRSNPIISLDKQKQPPLYFRPVKAGPYQIKVILNDL